MRADLTAFLAATDLDDVARACEEVTSVSWEDADALRGIVDHRAPRTAFENLLLHPQLLPPDRHHAVVDALAGHAGERALLASCVGVGTWRPPDTAVALRVAECLVELVSAPSTGRTIAMRASAALIEYGDLLSSEQLVLGLRAADPHVRRNVAAASIHHQGPARTVAAATAAGVPVAAVEELRALIAAERLDPDELVDDGPAVRTWAGAITPRADWPG